jgi:poly(hydroxyalkanoate) depolymerase family esterase
MSVFGKTLSKVGGLLLKTPPAAPQSERLQSERPQSERLEEVNEFGSNPGNMRMLAHIPRELPRNPALVVALHGYAQSVAAYDRGSGWSALADEHGFVVVYPEQQDASPQGCFSWLLTGNVARDRGEALSIRQMIDYAIRKIGVDARRVFVTGFCAGGALASAMLATYPDVFCSGAIIAGLPYGSASTVGEAFAAMFGARKDLIRPLGDRVLAASSHGGPWPKISVWHGNADLTIKPSNADDIVQQWAEVHGLHREPDFVESVDGHPRAVWKGTEGEPVIEVYMISDMGHGVPIADRSNPESCGAEGPFFVPVGISSTRRIAQFWGLGNLRKEEQSSASAALGAHELNSPSREPVFATDAAA